MTYVDYFSGWTRILAKRRPGNKKYGDIYYAPPKGKRLRSMTETAKFLAAFPSEGLSIDNFSYTDMALGHPMETITEPKS